MAIKKYHVHLTPREREELVGIACRGKTSGRILTRARILLQADEGLTDEEIAEGVETSIATIERTRQRFVAERLGALPERPRLGQPRKLDGKAEAHLVAVTCSTAPGGRERWTLRLLADQAVELGLAEALSHETVRQVLKKTTSNPGSTSSGASRRSAPNLSPGWKMSWTSTPSPTIRNDRLSSLTRRASS